MDPDQERSPLGLSMQDMMEEYEARQAAAQVAEPSGPEGDDDETEGGPLASTARGIGRGVNNIFGLANSFVKSGSRMTGLYKVGRDEEEEREWLETYEEHSTAVPFDIRDRPGGFWGFYEAGVQFATGFVPAARAIKVGNSLLKATTAGAVADFAAFDPHEERLANLVQSGPEWIQNPATDFLAAQEDDSQALGRFKNALEGVFLGGTIDLLAGGLRALKVRRAARNGDIPESEAAEQIQNVISPDDTKIRPVEDEPFRLEQDDDGRVFMVADEAEASKTFKLGDDVEARVEFETRGEAERAAASLNMIHRLNRKPADPTSLDSAQRSSVLQIRERIESGVEVTDTERLFHGIDLNFNRMGSGDETVGMLMAVTKALRGTFDAASPNRAGKRSQADIIESAEGIIQGVSGSEFVEHLRSLTGVTQVLPETVLAARLMLQGSAQRVHKISRAVDLDPTNAPAVRQLAEEMDGLADFAVVVSGVGSDLGRALKAMDIEVSDEALSAMKEGAEEATERGVKRQPLGFKKALTRKHLTAREVSAMARALQMSKGDANAALRVLRLTARELSGDQVQRGFWDKLVSFRASMMLSGLRTQFVNFASSTAAAFQIPAEVMIGGAVTGNSQMTRQGLDMLTSPFANKAEVLRMAARGAKDAWRSNRSILDPRFIKDEHGIQRVFENNPEAGWWVSILGAPGRALTTGDEFVKRMAYLSHVRSQSLRNLRQEALENGVEWTPKQINARLYDDMAHSVDEGGEALWYNSLEHARQATFTQKLRPGTPGRHLQDAANELPMVRLIVPFVRTPVNLFRFTHQRTPGLNLLNREYRDMIKAGGEDRARAIGMAISGSMAYSMASLLAHQGLLTGNGPGNPQLRAQLLESGWQPYSVRVGDKWISYRRMEPIATPMAIMADFFDMRGELDEQTMEEATMAFLAASTASVTSKSFLMGVTEFFEAVGSGEAYQMHNFLSSMATSFTPAFARQGNMDQYWREANSFKEDLMQSVPGFSAQLEPRRNIFGEPVVKTTRQAFGGGAKGYFNASFNPFSVIDASDIDDIQYELFELGKSMSMPQEKIQDGRINLRDRQKWVSTDPERADQSPYDRMMELVNDPPRGPSLRERLTSLMRSDRWSRMSAGDELFPGGMKHRMANKVVRQVQRIAWLQTLQEYPDLQRAVQQDRVSELEALFGAN